MGFNKKKITIGSWITLNNLSIAEILADSGFDWLCIDLEHSAIDYYEAQNLISIIQGKGLSAFVRVSENNDIIIKRILDAGADGLIVPMVNTEDDAKRAVNSLKYPPIGTRGVGLSRAQGYGFNFEKYKNEIAPQIKLIVQIEHVIAVENLEKILSIDGIDGTFIGPYDLSGSMGKPGDYNDEDVKVVLKKYETITKEYNKLIGYHVVQPDCSQLKDKINEGYNFLAFSTDTLFLGSKAREAISGIKAYLK
ncbi:aldolase/citrate lyase family protein [Verrucomicrobia bacterium]|nr:aldolase/citrate lyase family protein [Verrucomicrobiota bacterium]